MSFVMNVGLPPAGKLAPRPPDDQTFQQYPVLPNISDKPNLWDNEHSKNPKITLCVHVKLIWNPKHMYSIAQQIRQTFDSTDSHQLIV